MVQDDSTTVELLYISDFLVATYILDVTDWCNVLSSFVGKYEAYKNDITMKLIKI